jgi:hypothetical protein
LNSNSKRWHFQKTTNKQTNGVACCLLVAPRVMMDLPTDQKLTNEAEAKATAKAKRRVLPQNITSKIKSNSSPTKAVEQRWGIGQLVLA